MRYCIIILFCCLVVNYTGAQCFEYLSPMPHTAHHPLQTSIIVRPSGSVGAQVVLAAQQTTIRGSQSGVHTFKTIVADRGSVVVLKPDVPFAPRETVTVQFSNWQNCAPLQLEFTTVSNTRPLNDDLEIPAYNTPRNQPNIFDNIAYSMTEEAEKQSLFFTISGIPSEINILNENMEVLYSQSDASPLVANLRRHPDSTITYTPKFIGVGDEYHVALNANYQPTDTITCLDGYTTDFHDCTKLPNGNYLLIGVLDDTMDLSPYIALENPIRRVLSNIIQEIDPVQNVAVFTWRGIDYFSPLDSFGPGDDTLINTIPIVRLMHTNAAFYDTQRNTILLSSRGMDEITQIARNTGNIVWRFGGKNNQFHFLNDTLRFNYQHCVTRTPNGNLLLFDNHYYNGTQSRAVEYSLDENNMTATQVWEFKNPNPYISVVGGSAQRLPNGNTLISWGQQAAPVTTPFLHEVTPNGNIALTAWGKEGTASTAYYVYRAYKFPWANATLQTQNGASSNTSLTLQCTPNPASQNIQLHIQSPFTDNIHITLTDAYGKTHYQNTRYTSTTTYIAVQTLPAGIYFVTATTGAYTVTQRVLITH
jgi:hypothetical protein